MTTKTFVAIIVVALLGACAASAPEPTLRPTPAPTPTPRIEIVEVEVEVVPQVCLDAIDGLNAEGLWYISMVSDILNDYLDHPDENLAEFGQRVEVRIADATDQPTSDAVVADVRACYAAAGQ